MSRSFNYVLAHLRICSSQVWVIVWMLDKFTGRFMPCPDKPVYVAPPIVTDRVCMICVICSHQKPYGAGIDQAKIRSADSLS